MSSTIATFPPVLSTDQVNSVSFNWTQNGVPLPVHTVDPSVTTDTIPCVPGDVITVFVADTNVIGTTNSDVLTGTDPTPPPTTAPTKRTGVLTFAP